MKSPIIRVIHPLKGDPFLDILNKNSDKNMKCIYIDLLGSVQYLSGLGSLDSRRGYTFFGVDLGGYTFFEVDLGGYTFSEWNLRCDEE